MIVEMESEEDKDKVMRIGAKLWRKWRVIVDEDLTLKERRIRWRMMERARRERRERKRVVVSNRRMWMERKEWQRVEEEEK